MRSLPITNGSEIVVPSGNPTVLTIPSPMAPFIGTDETGAEYHALIKALLGDSTVPDGLMQFVDSAE